jgi:tetratricopeptide (TPR) repeat protein
MIVPAASASNVASRPRRAFVLYACLLLAALVLFVFREAPQSGFLAFDDDRYVDHNAALEEGLSVRGIAWAFRTNLTRFSESAEYWEPLTLITRLADYEMFRFAPWGHHVTSVLVHLATGLALFGALRRLTGCTVRSAMVAALFLVHPMHVEPVLWLSARKDLVNGLFYVLTLWAYGWYAARPGWRRYAVVFAAALAANMGKPMAVSLPLVLLLLDVWPLRRWRPDADDSARLALRLVVEKAPLLVLACAVAALAFLVQKDIGALAGDDVLPLPWRLGNAALALATYVVKAFAPVNLAFFYPHPGRNLNVPLAIVAALGALAITVVAVAQMRRRPWLAVGWLWLLVVLAPVLGVIQIGDQALADRYSYLSFIGLFIAVVWQSAEWVREWGRAPVRYAARWAAAGALAALSIASFHQVRAWRTSEAVFSHALAVTSGNYLAHYNLGAVLWEAGRRDEAMPHFAEAARLRAPFLRAQLAAADEAERRGAYGEAVPRLTRVLLLSPWNAELHQRLGTVLALDRQSGKALMQFDAALRCRPDWVQPRLSIAVVLLGEGQLPKAQGILREILASDPTNRDARALLDLSDRQAAASHPAES